MQPFNFNQGVQMQNVVVKAPNNSPTTALPLNTNQDVALSPNAFPNTGNSPANVLNQVHFNGKPSTDEERAKSNAAPTSAGLGGSTILATNKPVFQGTQLNQFNQVSNQFQSSQVQQMQYLQSAQAQQDFIEQQQQKQKFYSFLQNRGNNLLQLPPLHQQYYNSLTPEQRATYYGAKSAVSSHNWGGVEPESKTVQLQPYVVAAPPANSFQQPVGGTLNSQQIAFQLKPENIQQLQMQYSVYNQVKSQSDLFQQLNQTLQKQQQPQVPIQQPQSQDCPLYAVLKTQLQSTVQSSDPLAQIVQFVQQNHLEVEPTLNSLKQSPTFQLSNFPKLKFSNDFGSIELYGINIGQFDFSAIELKYCDFAVRNQFVSFMVILFGVYCEDETILKDQARNRGLTYVGYWREQKKLVLRRG